ncbi:acyltransferase domain-containing protein [Mycolicibacterium arseniciresistens]|uniref:Acyltransferase domain-containing protein n=1 Tax=Mycolicibacterium arseniciresistens TaxID=3062257 RepID=A0ABT8UPH0_9MYCO|nr:acyltransferase domain-containing protein [Mycolicibacterium arseniciresistens]MDO3639694.1 acyltransferase domain-containing protein [Mycolicibacterium arseniciresistens]
MADVALAPWIFSALFSHRAVAADAVVGKTVFVFPGHGSRWTDMAIELLQWAPAFASEMRSCDIAFAEFFDWSLLEVVHGNVGLRPFDRIDLSLPVSFAVMASLAAQWRELGIHPDAVLGHSHGEVAAAYIAGGLTLNDAARVVAQRAIAISSIAGTGGMVSIPWHVERVLSLIERRGEPITVAAQNGPASTVVTGPVAAIDELITLLGQDEVAAERIPVDYASQSAHIDELRPALRKSLSDLQPRTGDIPFISSVTGAVLDTSILDGDYWFANLRQPVLFEQAVRWSYQRGYPAFVECSPRPVLTAGIQQSLDESPQSGPTPVSSPRPKPGVLRSRTTPPSPGID